MIPCNLHPSFPLPLLAHPLRIVRVFVALTFLARFVAAGPVLRRWDVLTASAMSAIEILPPVSGPPGLRPPRSRGRFRPTLSSLGWIILYASTFLYYQHRLRDQSHRPAPSSVSPAVSHASDATPPSIATASCEVCHLNPADPLCEYGLDNIRLSRAYEGSGIRLRRVLEKALRGEEVGIGILGASVTAGHSVPYGKQRWEDRFFEDFQKLFPKAKMHVGAVSAVDSRVRSPFPVLLVAEECSIVSAAKLARPICSCARLLKER